MTRPVDSAGAASVVEPGEHGAQAIAAAADRVNAATLRAALRAIATPFALSLADGGTIVVRRLLRVLPGKRVVGEADWQGERVLVKAFIAAGSARHAAQETRGIEALRAAQLPTPELLLSAPLAEGGDVVVTRYLEGAESLADVAARAGLADGTAEALAVLRPAFATLGALHARGIVHDDLHFGNFLRADAALFIIDGDAVRVVAAGRALAAQVSTENLALLLAQLPLACDGGRGELVAAYLEGGGTAAPTRLERAVASLRERRLDDYLGKTLRDCTLFAARRDARRFSVVCRDEADRLRELVADPDAAIARGRLLKDGNTSTVALVGERAAPLVVKRYNIKSLGHRLSRFWRPTRAWHSWRAAHRLAFHGIATPAPLALVEERYGPFRGRGFLVTAYCPGTDLLSFLTSDRAPDAAVATAIVSLFARLYALRISHGDLKATNLLWHEGRVVVIDLDAMVRHRAAASHARAWRSDRARFLRNWPATSPLYAWLDRELPPG